jgi:fatty acid desaturase
MSPQPLRPRPTAAVQELRRQSLYAALSQEIQAMGLLRRRHGYYWTKISVVVAILAALVALHVLLGPTWWQLLIAGLLGIALTQAAFVGHEAGHRQIFSGRRGSEWTARLIGNLLVGMSYDWWNSKHNRHHGAPNQVGKDPDIEVAPFAWLPETAARRRGLLRWFTRRQGYLFFPLLLLEGIDLHAAGIRQIITGKQSGRRYLELVLITLRLGGYLGLVFLVLPPGMAAAFIGVQLAVFGLYMGSAFAPNHKGMPIVPRGLTVDFLRRQVLMSRNIKGGLPIEVLMGGLNYQVEHHLFPNMPRPNLRRAAPVVREFCERHGVRYTEVGLFASYGTVIRYLNQAGLGRRDPFACPLVTQYRPV